MNRISDATDQAKKREAFAAYDTYREQFERLALEITGVAATDDALTRNPLTMLVYADGYLAGQATATERLRALTAAGEALFRAARLAYIPERADFNRIQKAADDWRAILDADRPTP